MTTQTVTKNQNKLLRYREPLRVKRDIRAWKALAGIWKGRKLPDILRWQKNIRKEWEQELPAPR
jgi:hypothetical protein